MKVDCEILTKALNISRPYIQREFIGHPRSFEETFSTQNLIIKKFWVLVGEKTTFFRQRPHLSGYFSKHIFVIRFGLRPPVDSVFGHQKQRFPMQLSKMDLLETSVIVSCGRVDR